MSRNFASPHSDRECLYAPLRRTDELPGHVKTEALAELHNATFWNSQPAALLLAHWTACEQDDAVCAFTGETK